MMIFKHLFFVTIALLLSLQSFSQVTIGSGAEPDSNSLLDIKENSDGSSSRGLLLPRVKLVSTELPDPLTAHVAGMIVYNTGTSNDVLPGYYYNDGSKWLRLRGGANNTWLNSDTEVSSNSNADNIYHNGFVTIGDNQVDTTAILNVNSPDKGVLFPRVTLKSSKDTTTIPNPAVGLFVYNTGKDTAFTTQGYMFWDGMQWKIFASGSSEISTANLNCSGAGLSPSQQVIGGTALIDGTMLQIPYTRGNGGIYNGVTLTSVGNPNVVAFIQGGSLTVGNGVLNFSISGTPTVEQQAPNGITFDLTPFLEANPGIVGCDEVTVANVLNATQESAAVMGYLMYTEDNTGNDVGTKGYTLQCDSPDGKYSVRVRVPDNQSTIAVGNQYINIQIRNNQTTAQTVIWNYNTISSYSMNFNGANTLTLPPQRWGGNNSDSGGDWANATAGTVGYGGYWGNRGVYDGTGPEYRRYTWIPLGEDNNVSYEVHAMCALDTLSPSSPVSPTKLKVYIKFDQVTAVKN